ncbi:hypothetical protein KOW79_000426 [Hemibagrus wyckioides]|uniref:Uncharacterized protein n=1 Tax=Hemibagrus wyckioides TaxID=337641 RepID=A0A9D3SYK2_9TELE|nr:hypothetical protein KOW79_000426 [Hemibagrus wyckioides]
MLSAESLVGVGSAPPGVLAEINTECWDAASHALIEARRMRSDNGVAALWDFITRLQASPQPRHQELFMRLAQAFWERYVDCVLSRAHGLGRRRGPTCQFKVQVLSLLLGHEFGFFGQEQQQVDHPVGIGPA